jgi:hypothetical protein
MKQPPQSPDFAFCDFWHFPKLKIALKEQRYADVPDIQRNVTTIPRGIPEKISETVSGSDDIVSTKCVTLRGE